MVLEEQWKIWKYLGCENIDFKRVLRKYMYVNGVMKNSK